MSMIDWSKINVEEIKERWAKRRREMKEEEKKKRVDDKWRKVKEMRKSGGDKS